MSGTVPNGNAIKDVATGLASASLKSRNPRQHTPRHIRTARRVRAAAVQEYNISPQSRQVGHCHSNQPATRRIPRRPNSVLAQTGVPLKTQTTRKRNLPPETTTAFFFYLLQNFPPASSAPSREGNGTLKTQTTRKRTLPPETATAFSLTADLGPCVLSSPSRRKCHGSRSASPGKNSFLNERAARHRENHPSLSGEMHGELKLCRINPEMKDA
jgi:hypothetical protein